MVDKIQMLAIQEEIKDYVDHQESTVHAVLESVIRASRRQAVEKFSECGFSALELEHHEWIAVINELDQEQFTRYLPKMREGLPRSKTEVQARDRERKRLEQQRRELPPMPALTREQAGRLISAKKMTHDETVQWALDHSLNGFVTPDDCPTMEAWILLRHARENNKEFMLTATKVLARRDDMAAKDSMEPDDRRLLEVLDRVKDKVAEARAKRLGGQS